MTNLNPIRSRRERNAIILAAYESEAGRQMVRAALLLEYRCSAQNACLLLRAWRAPIGICYYIPAYTLSPTRNADTSVAAARAKNTRDGDRHWVARAGLLNDLDEWGPGVGLPLQCDHVAPPSISAPDLLSAASDARPGDPTRRLL